MRIHKRLIDLHSPSEIVKQIVSLQFVITCWGYQKLQDYKNLLLDFKNAVLNFYI